MQLTTLLTLAVATLATALPSPDSSSAQSKEIATLGAMGKANPAKCLPIATTMPTCGLECLADGAGTVGCHPLDFSCVCASKNHMSLKVTASYCITQKCSWEDAKTVSKIAVETCQCAGEPVN